ncbi:MAG TPA: alpha-N-arabinofuranosidase, partial [Bryobacteraceae bacterium]
MSRIGWEWRKHEAVLTTTAGAPESSANHFAILASPPGTVWLNMVSLFPPTYANRPNGNRRDIIERLAAMHPAFPRRQLPRRRHYRDPFQLEEKTIGDVARRHGYMNDAWHYWSSDGIGLLEFLDWCEDLHMDPVLALYAGLF